PGRPSPRSGVLSGSSLVPTSALDGDRHLFRCGLSSKCQPADRLGIGDPAARDQKVMRKSKQEAARTRDHIIEVAAQEFRRKGIAGTSLADVMAAAGLTHGGFYRHFESKDQLIAEACAAAVRAGEKTASTLLCPYKGDDLEAFAE